MIPVIIENINDERVDKYRNMKSTRSLLLKDRLTIGESEIVLKQALLSDSKIRSIILSQEYFDKYKNKFSADTEILLADSELIRNLAKYNLRNPILFIAEYENLSITNLSNENNFIYLNGIINFENVGAILRNAIAFGFDNVIYDYKSCTPYHHRSVVVSRGSVFHTKICKDVSKDYTLLKLLKSKGYKIISFEITENSTPLNMISGLINKGEKIVCVFGSEGEGVDKNILEMSDIITHIPMNTTINSINVAASSAIGMYLLSETVNLG